MHVGLTNRMDSSVFNVNGSVDPNYVWSGQDQEQREKRFISNLVFTVPMYLGDLVTNRPKLFTMTASPRLILVRMPQNFLIVKQSVKHPMSNGRVN